LKPRIGPVAPSHSGDVDGIALRAVKELTAEQFVDALALNQRSIHRSKSVSITELQICARARAKICLGKEEIRSKRRKPFIGIQRALLLLGKGIECRNIDAFFLRNKHFAEENQH
jgi:hypothetical protein